MASMNTRLNIEKLDGNIVQKHGGSKQVGFKKLDPGVETGVHGVHDEKRIWFEVELQGAQGDREADFFQVSNDDTVVAQRWLEDKQPEEKTNTNCLVKEQEKEYQTGWKIKRFGMSKVFWVEDTTRSTYLVNRSPSSAIGFKKPIDMLRFFGWFASIKQGMLEPVKFKCIFLGYHKSIVGNKLWRLDDVTSKVVLYRNMSFNESEEYKKTFIGSGVGTGSVQVLQEVEFEVEPEQHSAWELFSYREDSNEAAFAFAAVEKIYAHDSLTFNNTVASTVAGKAMTTATTIIESMHQATKGLLDKAKGNVLVMEIIRDQSGNTLRVSRSRFYNGKLVHTLLEEDSILSLEGSLSRDYDVEKMIFDYAMGDRILTEAGFMTFNEAWKKEIWLKGLLTESRYKLRLVAGIATGALVKGGSRSEVPAQVEVAAYPY
ncbi:hypothetical protein Tco_1548680 [Tanacetum coccineum]